MGADLIFIFLLALIIFGPKKMPQVAREVGRFVAEFKRASNDFKSQLQAEIERAGNESTARTSPQLSAPADGDSQSSPAMPSIASPALLAAAAQPSTPPASARPGGERQPVGSVLDQERERLLRTAHLAFDSDQPFDRPPLVPEAGLEPPPAPPPASPNAAQELEMHSQSVANASDRSSTPAETDGGGNASDGAETAAPAPQKS